uniref:Uncharacterized protein n=1 Tax=Anguilla anguilla TaxID=7936 RepID=A0A0E9RBK2_ANGAN
MNGSFQEVIQFHSKDSLFLKESFVNTTIDLF